MARTIVSFKLHYVLRLQQNAVDLNLSLKCVLKTFMLKFYFNKHILKLLLFVREYSHVISHLQDLELSTLCEYVCEREAVNGKQPCGFHTFPTF